MRLKIINFKKKYKNEIIEIPDIVFTKKVTFLVGSNGSGKSTVLKALLGLIKYEGEIQSDKTFSYMPENPIFPFDITVYTFLKEFINNKDEQIKLDMMIQNLNLEDKKEELISNLSKGMKAKVNLIQAILKDADYYLLDEPFSGLDKDGIDKLIKIIKKMRKKFIISSHLTNVIDGINGEVVIL